MDDPKEKKPVSLDSLRREEKKEKKERKEEVYDPNEWADYYFRLGDSERRLRESMKNQMVHHQIHYQVVELLEILSSFVWKTTKRIVITTTIVNLLLFAAIGGVIRLFISH